MAAANKSAHAIVRDARGPAASRQPRRARSRLHAARAPEFGRYKQVPHKAPALRGAQMARWHPALQRRPRRRLLSDVSAHGTDLGLG